MGVDFPTRVVREGLVDLVVPDRPQRPGPGVRSSLPFYNSTMAIARDVSVLVAHHVVPHGATVLDGLAATGALGLRIAVEAGNDLAVTLNDRNPRAAALIGENVRRNPARGVTVAREDLPAHLATHHYGYVEIDPFGSPVPFLDAALRSAHRQSLLGVAATDTAVLCGAKPEACRRRYLAHVRVTDAHPEVGARVLLGYIARMAGRFDKAVEPLLIFTAEHFVRAYVRITQGAIRSDRALANLGWVRPDPTTGVHAPVPAAVPGAVGPLWLGPILSPEVVSRLETMPHMASATARLVDALRGEAGLPPFYFENNATAGRLRVDPPPLANVLRDLTEAGYRAAPCHASRTGFKTDAPWEVVRRAYVSSARP